jgi:hypothetical protein
VHETEPVVVLYFPATHAVHVPPFGPVKPTLHVQAARAELEIGELELVGHARQAVAPTVVEYFPASQSMHITLPVVSWYFPASHDKHAVALICAENFPLSHNEHVLAPVAENVPGSH